MTDAVLKTLREIGLLHALSITNSRHVEKNYWSHKRPENPQEVYNLNLGNTRVTDAGMKELSELENLTWLSVTGTEITAAGLKELAGLRNLTEIRLDRERVTDAVLRTLREIGLLHALSASDGEHKFMVRAKRVILGEKIDLTDTQVSDAGLKALGELENLTSLELRNTRITDAVFRELAGAKSLQYLDLSKTQVTAGGLRELSGARNLERLILSRSQVTDAEVQDFKQLLPRCIVEVE